jgi:transcriptional regulator with XRE-family HTH domain
MNIAQVTGIRFVRQLSEATGYDFSYLSKVERGLAQPGLVPLRKWSRALGLSLARRIVDESEEESM